MLIKNVKHICVALSLAVVATVNQAQAEEPLSDYKSMLQKTVSSNPEVQARYHALLEAGFERDVMNGGFYPKADIVGRYRKQEDVSGNYSRQSRTGFANPRFNSELVISQMLFDGFATRSEVRRLDHNKKQAYYDLQKAIQDTALEFTSTYLDILRFRSLAEMAKDNYVIHRQYYQKIKERVDAGIARKVDLDQATGRVALAEANLLVETTNLHDVTAQMQRIYGDVPPASLSSPKVHQNGVESSIQEALDVAYHNNPELLATIEGIEANKDGIDTRKSAYMPRFDLEARKNIQHSRNGRFNDAAADAIELQFSWNLFNGFSDKNAIQQAAQQLNGAKDLRDKACIDTRQTVVVAYNDIKQLTEQLSYRLAHKTSIESAKQAYLKQFDIGQRTLLDLLDTENEYFQAKRSLTNTEYDLQTAYARVYAGQGELLKKTGVQREDVAEIGRDEYLNPETICKAGAPTQLTFDKDALVADAKIMTPPILPVAPKKLAAKPVVPPCSVKKVTNTVKDWAYAATQKNVANYLYFYDDTYSPDNGLTRDQWETKKRKQMRRRGKTQWTVSDINATCNGNDANADFKLKSVTTRYKLKKVADTSCEVCNMKRIAIKGKPKRVDKKLTFKKVAGQWKIVDEQPL